MSILIALLVVYLTYLAFGNYGGGMLWIIFRWPLFAVVAILAIAGVISSYWAILALILAIIPEEALDKPEFENFLNIIILGGFGYTIYFLSNLLLY